MIFLILAMFPCIALQCDTDQFKRLGNCNCNRTQLAEGGSFNEYYLYTRKNNASGKSPEVIKYGESESLLQSTYDAEKTLVVISHGWQGDYKTETATVVRDAFLTAADYNVIVLDWSTEAASCYLKARGLVTGVGKTLGFFLEWLLKTGGGSWDKVHLVGFSLGAHVVGNAGRAVNGKVKRITGLDPAGIGFMIDREPAININDARYVEIIHTDVLKAGISRAIGHVDFYPNGGYIQPGCLLQGEIAYDLLGCSHMRAPYLYAASIIYKNKLIGKRCASYAAMVIKSCRGESFVMGNDDVSKSGCGIYRLETTGKWPFFSDFLKKNQTCN